MSDHIGPGRQSVWDSGWTIVFHQTERIQSKIGEAREGSGCRGSVKSQLLEGEGEKAGPGARRTGRTWLRLEERKASPEKEPLLTLHFFTLSHVDLTVLRGFDYTHFTDYHGGAKGSDSLKISQLLSDSWDSNAEPPFILFFPRPRAASWRPQRAAWEAWRVGKGSPWRG